MEKSVLNSEPLETRVMSDTGSCAVSSVEMSGGGNDERVSMYELREVSSLNLRRGRNQESRELSEPIRFQCDVFGKRHHLGKDAWVMVKLMYGLNGELRGISVADKAIDVLADLVRFGPRVLAEGRRWELSSYVVRAGLVRMKRQCRRCMGVNDTHLLLKFDDLRIPGKSSQYVTVRVCARCAICYLRMMEESKEIRGFKYRTMETRESSMVV